jgi:hypothetical protein
MSAAKKTRIAPPDNFSFPLPRNRLLLLYYSIFSICMQYVPQGGGIYLYKALE